MKRYDIHAHLGRTSSGEENSPAMLVEQLTRFGISRVGVCCLSGSDNRAQNDLIHQLMLAYPDFVEGYAFLNPKSPAVFDEIDRCLGDFGMNGVKFNSWKHGYFGDNCPEIDDVLTAVEHYGVQVQVHVGTSPLCTPWPWIEYAKRHPKLDMVFTHMGCHEFGYSTVEAIREVPGIWVETSCQMEVEVLRKAFDQLGSHRIVFGTDWPYKATNAEIEKLFLLGLSDREMEDVFYKNAEILWCMN